MGTVSAIPEHLVRYAAACTWGATEFQNWVRTVLTPALREYEMSPGAVVCSTLDTDVARQIAAAFYTDRNVRTVGLAFLATQHGDLSAPDPKLPVYASDDAVGAAYQLLEQEARQPTPAPGQSPTPPGLPALSDGFWDLVPAPMNLSHELWGAYDYTMPYVDPDGTKYSRRADAVLSWIEAHRDLIDQEAARQGISPKAIAAVIAWEALNNVQPPFPVTPGTKVHGYRISQRWTGPGKVHFIDSRLVEQVEARGYLPRVSEAQRGAILSTDEGSIRYIAAIMRGIADATDRVPEYRRYDARDNVALLTHVYQGGGPASNLETWEAHLRGNHGKDLRFDNDMAKWAAQHPEFLNDAVRPWQPGDGPPPHLVTPTPRAGPSPTPR